MSSDNSPDAAASQINQFIRPTPMSPCDTASAAERLALKGADFATSDEVAAAIEGGVAAELAFAVMAALGSRFEQLADEDVRPIEELYTAAPSAAKMTANAVVGPDGPSTLAKQEECSPLSSLETGGDEAAGSPAAAPPGRPPAGPPASGRRWARRPHPSARSPTQNQRPNAGVVRCDWPRPGRCSRGC